MGCPMGACTGYELMNNLDFATATTSLRTWARPNYDYRGILEGNGYTISNLRVTSTSSIGLFTTLDTNGVIRNVGLVNPTVAGRQTTGGLAGTNLGTIVASYVSGGAISANGTARMGGLVGQNAGAIIASYSTASVSAGGYNGDFGGLVGRNQSSITASYAIGAVTGTGAFTDIGGLAGEATHASSAITDSYCGAAAGQANCIGNPASSAGRYAAAQLQTPTTYTGIYARWNVDLNSDDIPDNPWNFGATTTYPVLYTPAQRQTAVIDYDADNDNLIDIDTLHQLNAIRWDLNGNGVPDAAANTTTYAAAFPNGNIADTSTPYMGCESTCEGYELTANLDFAADGVAVTSTDPYPNWSPIGGVFIGQSYAAEFNGNGHTITRLTITGGGLYVGLFGTLDANGVIRDLGMIDASVSGSGSFVGILAGINSGDITSSYIRDGSVTGTATLGGNHVGGLTGRNRGTIRASYSTASVNETSPSATTVGGLVGRLDNGKIIASYAAGPVSGAGANTYVGGIVGSATGTSAVITNSYCDTTVHGTSTCIGANTGGSTAAAAGYTTAQLRTPTGYTGIYANWNVDLNSDDIPDNPWNFGATTTYPALYTPAQRQTEVIDYDTDNDNLIDIDTLHKLNAIRWDLDGNGVPDAAANTTTYAAAFPSGNIADTSTPYMGCAATCTGYELTANINFAADGAAVTGTDPYPNWTPIGPAYAATFDGKGNTINHLTITGATGNSGLFNTLATGAVIRDVGMLAASIGNNGADAYVGVLAGDNDGGMIITSYAAGGAVTVTGTSTYAGGLIGRNAGDVRAVYSTAAVNASSTATSTIGGLIGLHAGSVQASYAAGTTTGSAAAIVGGFAGAASSTNAAITNGYCDTDATGQSNCIGAQTAGATATSTGYTTSDLRTPTSYTGIYESWNIRLGSANTLDDPWDFGTTGEYPTIKALAQRVSTTPPPPPIPPPPPPDPTPTPTSTPATSTDPVPGDGGNGGNGNGETATSTDPVPGDGGNGGSATSTDTLPPAPTPPPTPDPTPDPTDSGNGRTGTSTDTLPPPLPRTIPTEPEREYNPAVDHPEIYANAEYGMAATCRTHDVDPETGNPRAATVTFDLGSYTGPVLLHLSIWRNGRYMAYETQGIALPTLERDGQRATLRVDTDPAQTRFRLDGRRHGLAANLLLGYANCDTDDP